MVDTWVWLKRIISRYVEVEVGFKSCFAAEDTVLKINNKYIVCTLICFCKNIHHNLFPLTFLQKYQLMQFRCICILLLGHMVGVRVTSNYYLNQMLLDFSLHNNYNDYQNSYWFMFSVNLPIVATTGSLQVARCSNLWFCQASLENLGQ